MMVWRAGGIGAVTGEIRTVMSDSVGGVLGEVGLSIRLTGSTDCC